MGEESKIEKDVCKYAQSKGCYVRKFTGRAGVPDHYFLTPNGFSFFLEFKRPGEKPTPLQDREIREIRKRKGAATWIDNVEDGKKLVDHYLKVKLLLEI